MAAWSVDVRQPGQRHEEGGAPRSLGRRLGDYLEDSVDFVYEYPLDERMRAPLAALAAATGDDQYAELAAQETLPISLVAYAESSPELLVEIVVALRFTLEEARLLEPDGPPAR